MPRLQLDAVARSERSFLTMCVSSELGHEYVSRLADDHFSSGPLRRVRDQKQIVFRYASEDGRVVKDANPNGSLDNIAGLINEEGTVLGLMPHPERASENAMGGTDGLLIFHSLLGSLVEDGTFSKR